MGKTSNGSSPVGLTQYNETVNRIYDKVDETDKKVNDIAVSLARLETAFKIKSGIWGLLGGLIPLLIAVVWYFIKSRVAT